MRVNLHHNNVSQAIFPTQTMCASTIQNLFISIVPAILDCSKRAALAFAYAYKLLAKSSTVPIGSSTRVSDMQSALLRTWKGSGLRD